MSMIDVRLETSNGGTAGWFRVATLFCALAALDMAGGAWVSFAGARTRAESGPPLLAVLMLLAAMILAAATVLSFRQRRVAGALVCAAYLMTAVPVYLTTAGIAGPTLFMIVSVFAMAMPAIRRTGRVETVA